MSKIPLKSGAEVAETSISCWQSALYYVNRKQGITNAACCLELSQAIKHCLYSLQSTLVIYIFGASVSFSCFWLNIVFPQLINCMQEVYCRRLVEMAVLRKVWVGMTWLILLLDLVTHCWVTEIGEMTPLFQGEDAVFFSSIYRRNVVYLEIDSLPRVTNYPSSKLIDW